ncbi:MULTISPECIES: hypothetical protein [unclassified Paenibacillus]|uniref:hypothetical protein n=1 Tax=unclassified Paenibacillus TaxID=185978 RepID=UPI001F3E93C3|nr:hypothetical protein [Paenibacillus sp. JJ-223]
MKDMLKSAARSRAKEHAIIMRQSTKESRSRMEPLLPPGSMHESLQLARAAADCVAAIWFVQEKDKGKPPRLPRV